MSSSTATTSLDITGYDESQRAPGSFSDHLWTAAAPIYGEILHHPFIEQVGDGSLVPEVFINYLAQDEHYIHDYVRCMCLLASRAPTYDLLQTFVVRAAALGSDESGLHQRLLDQLGADPSAVAAIQAAPTTSAYTSWMLAVCERESYLSALVSIMPCYWIYGRVGKFLQLLGSPNPAYQEWITSYGGSEYNDALAEALDIMDDLGAAASHGERAACTEIFTRGAQYEWAFWDGALRLESWPVS